MSEEHIRTPVQQAAPAEMLHDKPSAAAREEKLPPQKDSLREIVETIVFVIVLVLLLKTFIAEAFVIPTGSMATTLLGNHLDVACPKCGHHFIVNASDGLDDQEAPAPVKGCTCENCGYHIRSHELMQILGNAP